MPTLAPKLPWTHAFAGGYPRVAGQPLPTDPDAIDYLERVVAADGAAVEVGVAMAVDQFVKGCKADSAGYAGDPTRTVWDALQACCIMCGARTLAGALVPLKGASPTNVANNFVSSDYSRTTGLKGDGSTKYLDTNRAGDADGQDDRHHAVYVSAAATSDTNYLGTIALTPSRIRTSQIGLTGGDDFIACSDGDAFYNFSDGVATGLIAAARSESNGYTARRKGSSVSVSSTSVAPVSSDIFVLALDRDGVAFAHSDARLAFYSIGASLSLESLDNRVSTLVAAIAAAI